MWTRAVSLTVRCRTVVESQPLMPVPSLVLVMMSPAVPVSSAVTLNPWLLYAVLRQTSS